MAATLPPSSSDFKRAFRKFLPHLLQAQSDGLNEADTVQRISKLFEEVLGYDALEEITFEAQMKGKFVDMTLKLDGKIRVLVEAKAAGITLRDRHIEQAQSYASQNNYRWVLLTNGVAWNLYHLTFEEGIEYEKAFAIDVTKNDLDEAAAALYLLRRDSIRKGHLDEYWARAAALSPDSLGRAIFTQDIMRSVRRELRRNEGMLVDVEDIAKGLHDMLSPEARELLGPVRLKKRRKRSAESAAEAAPVPPSEATIRPAR